MNGRSLWKYLPPAGPVLSLALIGLLLLSALLYYRAIKIQRFLEPALAISQPRNEFAQSVNLIFQKEFGAEPLPGIKVRTSSLAIKKSLLFSDRGTLRAPARIILKKFARLFLSLLEDDHARPNISLVLINARFPADGTRKSNGAERIRAQRMVGQIQDSLFEEEPKLGKTYGAYFVAAAQPAHPNDGNIGLRTPPGGDGQPQTQAAVFTRHAMFGQDLQQAISAPRWLLGRTWGAMSVSLKLESRFDGALVDALRAAGHDVEMLDAWSDTVGHAGDSCVSSIVAAR